MEAKKIVAIVVNVTAGFTVILVGLAMLPFPLNIAWGVFNFWIWIVSPAAILRAERKDENKF